MDKVCETWLKNSLSSYILWKKTNNITISFANFYLGVVTVLKTQIPYGKVALVLSKKTYLEIGKQLMDKIKNSSNKVVALILEDERLNQSNVDKIFSLPEDVRAVVVMNGEFFDLASYYSTFNKTLLVAVYTKMSFCECFKKKVYFNDNNIIRRYGVECRKSFVFDVREIIRNSECNDKFVSSYCSKILAPIDYKFNLLLGGEKEFTPSVNQFFPTIRRIIEKLKDHPTKIDLELFLLALRLEIINGMTGGKLFDCFSAKIASSSLEIEENSRKDMEIHFAIIFCKLYLWALKGKIDEQIPDSYSARAHLVQKFYGVSQRAVIKDYLKTAKNIREQKYSNARIDGLIGELEMASEFLNLAHLVLYSYKDVRFDLKRQYLNACTFAGDLPKRANGMTYIREKCF